MSRRSGALSPKLLFAVIEATRTAMVVSDPRLPDNPIVFADRAFRELSGYPDDELIGTAENSLNPASASF